MSTLVVKYDNLPNPVGELLKTASLATTATVPVSASTSLVFTTGHVGLDLHSGALVNDSIENEFEAIFNCLDAALRHAGAVEGLRQAYKFTSYLTRAEDEQIMYNVFRKICPQHTPTWCLVIVGSINIEGMSAEIAAEGAIFHSQKS